MGEDRTLPISAAQYISPCGTLSRCTATLRHLSAKTDRRLTFNYYFVPENNELRPGPRQKDYFLLILTKGHVGRKGQDRTGKQSMYMLPLAHRNRKALKSYERIFFRNI